MHVICISNARVFLCPGEIAILMQVLVTRAVDGWGEVPQGEGVEEVLHGGEGPLAQVCSDPSDGVLMIEENAEFNACFPFGYETLFS